MLRFGGAVIRMQSSLDNTLDFDYLERKVTFCVGNIEIIKAQKDVSSLTPFSDKVLNFLDAFSKRLFKNPESKRFPDVITLGFWCRKASVLEMKNNILRQGNRLGRGVAFHIAPSNVAVNFAYSLIASLLAGNSNIVRLPSKHFEQVDIIIKAFNDVLADNSEMSDYIILVKYERDKKINDMFSALCDVRVIWGGDNTIATLRQSPIGSRTKEICFADRYAVCVINSDAYVDDNRYDTIAKNFYNDTYLSDQNACSSPKLIVWTGNNADKAREIFWNELKKITSENYHPGAVQVVGKLDAIYKYAAEAGEGVNPQYISFDDDNKINIVRIDSIEDKLIELEQNSGLFFEYVANDLKEILPVCTKKLQTIAVYGIDRKELEEFFISASPRGIDRVVPIGKTMDFSLTWDGYNLIDEMSREVYFTI